MDLMLEYRDSLKLVTLAIAKALDIDQSIIQPDSFLIRDLHAESIDFISIAFEIEKDSDKKLDLMDLYAKAFIHPENRPTDILVEGFARYIMLL